jgi:hypothetical protein
MSFPLGVGEFSSYPPVNARAAASREWLFGLTRGAHSYSMGAGGFDQVPAMPQMQRFSNPVRDQAEPNIRLVELYAQAPGLFRQRLQSMFISRPAPGKELGF